MMDSIQSKSFGVGTQGSSVNHSGFQAGDNSQVSVGGNVLIKYSFGNSERKIPLIPLHKYPVCRNFFGGRVNVLQQVKDSIILCEKEKTSFQRIVAIIGLGGMGKSEIAKVLAKELQSEYEYIFWFDAQTKTSLESDLQNLASILKISWTSEQRSLKSVLWDVYHSLAENYKNGILIFDNVEVLKAEEGNFALENYLLPDSHCQKPVFLVTSRNPMGSERDNIKCVHLNRLSDEESQQCMLNFLGIENHPLPPSLTEGITSLVKMLEGHPLGLSLLGQGLYDEVESIHLNKTEIESRVRSYITLLKDSGLKDIPGQSKYEDNLQVITDWTIEKLLETVKGKIAVELLSIVALLSPDDIHAGLVNGIYSEKPFETHPVLCPKFVWDDLETTVRSGLKLLQSNSLLKIERKAYAAKGYQYNYDMIKIHRLIQQSAQNRLLRQNKSLEPLKKILGFTERSRLNVDHVHFLLNFCFRNRLAYLHPETCCLQILVMHLEAHILKPTGDYGVQLLHQVRDVLTTKKEVLHPDCSKTLCLFEMYLHRCTGTLGKYELDQLKRSIVELSPEFSIQRWLLQLVMLILNNLQYRHVPSKNYVHLVRWVVKNYTDVKEDSRRYLRLTEFVLRHDCDGHIIGNRDWSIEREFISKVFACTSESRMGGFWYDMYRIIDAHNTRPEEQCKQFVQCLLTSPETNFFSRSLQFSQDSFKLWFIINSKAVLDWVRVVTQYPELTASLLATEGFLSSLWDLTEFGFRQLSSSWKHMSSIYHTRCFEDITRGLGNLMETWCYFFAHDIDLYGRFGEKFDSEVEDLLQCPWDKKSMYTYFNAFLLNKYCIKMSEFSWREHCSPRTRMWIQKLLQHQEMDSSDCDTDTTESDST